MQHHGLFREKSKQPFKIGTAERKILIIFSYYVLLATIAFTAFTVATRTVVQFAAAVADYGDVSLLVLILRTHVMG